MRKRQKLVLTACILSLGLLIEQSVGFDWKYPMVALVSALTWVLALWALREGITKIGWLIIPLPSVLFTASVGLFYVLLPQSMLARSAIILLFGIGQYALLLTANIYSVAAIRTIALFRAASAVGFVMILLSGFFLFDTILSFRMYFWGIGFWVFVASFLLILPGLWSVNLEDKLSKRVIGYSAVLSAMISMLAMAIAFWPISIAVSSLFLCAMIYVYLGIVQHHFSQRLFTKTVWEYVTVGVVVLITMLLTAGWGV